MKKSRVVFSAVLLALALLAAVAPYTFAKVCPLGETVMRCHWTARAVLFTGLCAAAFALLRFFARPESFLLGLDAAIIADAAGIILFPTVLIGVCGGSRMHCHAVTQPALIVLGILLLAVAAADAVLLFRGRRSGKAR
ncbi:MAG TPA: DUF4418 domain-containing protein [Treponema sp.]|nr:DUF4418 domain-containing protein [Treponema sp.]